MDDSGTVLLQLHSARYYIVSLSYCMEQTPTRQNKIDPKLGTGLHCKFRAQGKPSGRANDASADVVVPTLVVCFFSSEVLQRFHVEELTSLMLCSVFVGVALNTGLNAGVDASSQSCFEGDTTRVVVSAQ